MPPENNNIVIDTVDDLTTDQTKNPVNDDQTKNPANPATENVITKKDNEPATEEPNVPKEEPKTILDQNISEVKTLTTAQYKDMDEEARESEYFALKAEFKILQGQLSDAQSKH